jgi:hypothetical protein
VAFVALILLAAIGMLTVIAFAVVLVLLAIEAIVWRRSRRRQARELGPRGSRERPGDDFRPSRS